MCHFYLTDCVPSHHCHHHHHHRNNLLPPLPLPLPPPPPEPGVNMEHASNSQKALRAFPYPYVGRVLGQLHEDAVLVLGNVCPSEEPAYILYICYSTSMARYATVYMSHVSLQGGITVRGNCGYGYGRLISPTPNPQEQHWKVYMRASYGSAYTSAGYLPQLERGDRATNLCRVHYIA